MNWKSLLNIFKKNQNTFYPFNLNGFGSSYAQINLLQNDNELIKVYNSLVEVRSIIDYIATNRSKIKFELWQGTEENPIKKVENHPVIDLLKQPNQFDSIGELRKKRTTFQLLTGNSYLNAIKPTGFNKVTKLFVLPTNKVAIKTNGQKDFRLTEIVNYQLNSNGNFINILPELVLHSKEINIDADYCDYLFGISPLISSKYPISSLESAYSAKVSLYQHGPKAILTGKNGEFNVISKSEAKEELENLNNKFGLTESQYQYMISRFPLDVTQISHSVSELQINENNLADFQALCKVYNIPSIILNDNTNSTYNNIKEAKTQVWFGNFIPAEQDFAADLCNWLLELFGETKEMFFKLDLNNIQDIKESTNEQSSRILDQYTKGIITMNEAREKLGYSRVSNGDNFNVQQAKTF